MAKTDQLVSLGFKDVAPEEKTKAVGDIFARVASRYDLMNDLMSGGMHRLWKNEFVQLLKPQPHEHILDLAGGTGDIAFRIAKRGAKVTGVDAHIGSQITDLQPYDDAYRLLAEGQSLPEWHPLITGSRSAMHQAGQSVRGKVVHEAHAGDWIDHIITWAS